MKGGVLLIFTAPSHGPCFSLPCLTQPWAPKSARASHHYPREAYGMSSVPCLRQGPRTLCVPSMLASDRGQGPSVCPVSLPQTGAKDPPSAQYPCLRQGPRTPRVPSSMCSRQMPLKRSQCNNVLMREEACVFRFPHKSPRP